MARYSVAMLNNMVAQYEVTVGTSPTLEFRTGPPNPAGIAAADTGTLLVAVPLPLDWASASGTGAIALLGTWSGTGASVGVIGHYRLKSSGGTCHEDGTVTVTGAGGDITVDNTSVAIGQPLVVTAWNRNVSP